MKPVIVFVTHQFISTWGIVVLAALAATSVHELLGLFRLHPPIHYLYWILTENPYYPVQIAFGLYLGWALGRRLQHRSMTWVWVLPLTILCYALFATPVLIPEWTSVLARPQTTLSRLSYYFGWDCQPTAHCLDQIFFTLPFYASVAYSVGAMLARKMSRLVDGTIINADGAPFTR
jgi:hypothetical protein